MDAIAALFRSPKLYCCGDRVETVGGEEGAEKWVGDHGGLDARIMSELHVGERLLARLDTGRRRGLGRAQTWQGRTPIDLAADQSKAGEAAARKTEETYPVRSDF